MASSETQQMCEALTLAIQAGDVHRAQELVFMLTQSRTPVNIGFDAAAEERKAREQEIRSVGSLLGVVVVKRDESDTLEGFVYVLSCSCHLSFRHTYFLSFSFCFSYFLFFFLSLSISGFLFFCIDFVF